MTNNEHDAPNVPYIVHEGTVARLERIIKRLIIAIVVLCLIILTCNSTWLYAWCQYDYYGEETETVTIDGKEGVANYIGNDGDINNGKDYSETGKKTGESQEIE